MLLVPTSVGASSSCCHGAYRRRTNQRVPPTAAAASSPPFTRRTLRGAATSQTWALRQCTLRAASVAAAGGGGGGAALAGTGSGTPTSRPGGALAVLLERLFVGQRAAAGPVASRVLAALLQTPSVPVGRARRRGPRARPLSVARPQDAGCNASPRGSGFADAGPIRRPRRPCRAQHVRCGARDRATLSRPPRQAGAARAAARGLRSRPADGDPHAVCGTRQDPAHVAAAPRPGCSPSCSCRGSALSSARLPFLPRAQPAHTRFAAFASCGHSPPLLASPPAAAWPPWRSRCRDESGRRSWRSSRSCARWCSSSARLGRTGAPARPAGPALLGTDSFAATASSSAPLTPAAARRVPPLTQTRLQAAAAEGLGAALPPPDAGYAYVVAKLGPLQARTPCRVRVLQHTRRHPCGLLLPPLEA